MLERIDKHLSAENRWVYLAEDVEPSDARATDETLRRTELLQKLKTNCKLLSAFLPILRCSAATLEKDPVQYQPSEFCQAIWGARDDAVEVS